MNMLLQSIYDHAARHGDRIALHSSRLNLSYTDLTEWIGILGPQLHTTEHRTVGLLMDNCPAWAVIDLTCQYADCTLVPLPAFFSNSQLHHVIADAGIDLLLTDDPARLDKLDIAAKKSVVFSIDITGTAVFGINIARPQQRTLPPQTTKITYTSGSSGQPKGVCLDWHAIESVTQSLSDALVVSNTDCHLALMPLSTLLENIGGLYVPLLKGGSTVLENTATLGTRPGRIPDIRVIFDIAVQHQCSSMTLTPELLKLFVRALDSGMSAPPSLRFVAVGSAPVSTSLLDKAKSLGLPVYQGYGLSECASVVTVNTPEFHRAGSAGKALSHCQITIADDSEILVRGPHFRAYLGQSLLDPSRPWATGDIGHLDEDGYLYVTGRKKNILITSEGRNISPEWIEKELTASALILRAFVFCHDEPQLHAVIWPASGNDPGDVHNRIAAIIDRVNAEVPVYARIRSWLTATTPAWQIESGTGLDRQRLENHYRILFERQSAADQAAAS